MHEHISKTLTFSFFRVSFFFWIFGGLYGTAVFLNSFQICWNAIEMFRDFYKSINLSINLHVISKEMTGFKRRWLTTTEMMFQLKNNMHDELEK